ncbi:hypothetical protein GCM10009105_32210 [Dokdonella soli]|uniref:Delta-60 repeat domain-containing protein n=2 Tax=Dokdonella soli TaxID=529810 RepID=A0ABN1IUN5_9GAMM
MIFSHSVRADSDLDPIWDPPGGYTVTVVGTTDAFANAVAVDSLGRVVVGGYSYPVAGGNPQFTVVRYHGDDNPSFVGMEDTDFNNTGIATVPAGIDGASGYAVQVCAGDGIVIAGDCTNPAMPQNHSFCLARFTSTGGVDSNFGTAGTVVTRIGRDDAYAKAMTTDSSGSILVAGYSSSSVTGHPVFTVVRYNGSGIEDTNFGTGGVATVAAPGGGAAQASAIAVDSNGSIIVAGTVADLAHPNGALGVARLLPNGAPDPTFHGGAIAIASFANGGNANAVAVDQLNRPIVAGTAFPIAPAATATMALARFTSGGLADTSFGGVGQVNTPLDGCTDGLATGVQVDASGRLFVSGSCRTTQQVLVLAHYNADATLDSAFSPGGYTTALFGSYAGASAVILDGTGRPLVVGSNARIANGFNAFVINRHDYIFSHGFE